MLHHWLIAKTVITNVRQTMAPLSLAWLGTCCLYNTNQELPVTLESHNSSKSYFATVTGNG